eukprot:CAMPEP_0176214956 /NCGR_PEP_ID=MMETSP0121_2-20121125/16436_1 /TAXON_ID=160619 /ORGANISM="Kryptoperidinium foliaceum, Strain CCMP 1326" /LENGTH=245 /DNA_ID=CAMNT_0017554055 /DNA_START=56 /DNA_END=791 /DNA_ORIENTATION=+
MAWDSAIEGSWGTLLGGPLVAVLAQSLFGFTQQSLGDGDAAVNAEGLGRATATMICGPALVSALCWFLLHWTYPRDAARAAQMQQVAGKSGKAATAAISDTAAEPVVWQGDGQWWCTFPLLRPCHAVAFVDGGGGTAEAHTGVHGEFAPAMTRREAASGTGGARAAGGRGCILFERGSRHSEIADGAQFHVHRPPWNRLSSAFLPFAAVARPHRSGGRALLSAADNTQDRLEIPPQQRGRRLGAR